MPPDKNQLRLQIEKVSNLPILPGIVTRIAEMAKAKLIRIEDQVKRIAEVTERLRKLDGIATNEYIRNGEDMVDVWNEKQREDEE